MQTFLPYPDFARSALVLDQVRLGNQRREALTLVRGGWKNHPASRIWRGFEYQLAEYGKVVCRVWRDRGFKDNCLVKFTELQASFPVCSPPPWFGDEDFHRAHQSNLVRKDPAFYGPLFPGVPSDLPYVWPFSPEESS